MFTFIFLVRDCEIYPLETTGYLSCYMEGDWMHHIFIYYLSAGAVV